MIEEQNPNWDDLYPGIANSGSWLWIPGSRFARPGMTRWGELRHKQKPRHRCRGFVFVERDPGSVVHRFALHRVRDDFVA
ncbi:hypothetical protein BJA5080_07906 [Bradyrhizobium diazoefficiens SEMIA 5080]|uniref:Uncharacterized protein n=1 Tax=Bradyrhizobium diazoefficiens SEMIA 5080 TaxID=754504 RepID=A0A837CQH5_9BRAD|nr:hypothetical protein BJA5080_07906 [Bradyrhizobium diazoefficiens SEMIA 5080]